MNNETQSSPNEDFEQTDPKSADTVIDQVNSGSQPDSTKAFGLFLFDFLKVFLVAVLIIVPVRYFLFQPFVVNGSSMIPSFHDGDYLIIDEISYRLREPVRGEVVVMKFPNDPSEFFIKRIIGLPGERIVIENGQITVYANKSSEGSVLKEQYLPEQLLTVGNIDITLRSDEYYVLGDNRNQSSDSRFWGPLERDLIVGRAIIRAFPIGDFTFFSSPDYQ